MEITAEDESVVIRDIDIFKTKKELERIPKV